MCVYITYIYIYIHTYTCILHIYMCMNMYIIYTQVFLTMMLRICILVLK